MFELPDKVLREDERAWLIAWGYIKEPIVQTTEQKVNVVIDHILFLAKRREEIDQELTKERAELMKLVFAAQEQHEEAPF